MNHQIDRSDGTQGEPGEPCSQCQHPLGPHKLIARGTPIQEGLIVCPEEGCYCLSTFDIPDRTVMEDVQRVFHEEHSNTDTIG